MRFILSLVTLSALFCFGCKHSSSNSEVLAAKKPLNVGDPVCYHPRGIGHITALSPDKGRADVTFVWPDGGEFLTSVPANRLVTKVSSYEGFKAGTRVRGKGISKSKGWNGKLFLSDSQAATILEVFSDGCALVETKPGSAIGQFVQDLQKAN